MTLLKGQMMIEVVVAFTITVIALVGLLQLTRRSVGSAGGSGRVSTATAYANAGIDWISNEKTVNGWAGLRDRCLPVPGATCGPTAYCLGDLDWSSPSCNISGTEFDRNVTLTVSASMETKSTLVATVVVSWTEGNRPDSVTRTFRFIDY
jgi:hypothetical protein